MKLRFKDRIAIFNLIAVAITTALVFLVIYFVVHDTAYNHLDDNILIQKGKIFNTLVLQGNSIITTKLESWDKVEEKHVSVSPVFVEVTNKTGKIIFYSSDLVNKQDLARQKYGNKIFYNGFINDQKIRLGRFPVQNDAGENIGTITIAISAVGTHYVLNNLIWTLAISFPIVLFVLFLASSLAASRAIRPVNQLTRTASRINYSNISTRLQLPAHKDELFDLTKTLNELLDRIEDSLVQQKQFTSDASHEIRTPIAAIRGTLEVLLRKEREPRVYVAKISGIIKEFDRLDTMLDQLLQLARIENKKIIDRDQMIKLNDVIKVAMKKCEQSASKRKIIQISKVPKSVSVFADKVYLEVILDNLLNNAIKYGKENGNVYFSWDNKHNTLAIQDDGIGISGEHLPKIFNRFYRVDESRSSVKVGNGLGLSIVKRLASLQGIEIKAISTPKVGSTFYLCFPS